MSMPLLLLVDDSEAILAFEAAALAGHYACATACNGQEALDKMAQLKPAAVLLDLSMPVLDGDQVFAQMRQDRSLAAIPVIVVSSEKQRAEACLRAGARAVLHKPVRAAELLETVGRVLEELRRAERDRSLAVLRLRAGPVEVALPLSAVETVLPQVLLRPLPAAPAHVLGVLDLRGQPRVVLDLAGRLGHAPHQRLPDRKLVVLRHAHLRLALCVDDIRDPEEIPAADIHWRDTLAGTDMAPLRECLLALVRWQDGFLPVLDVAALFSADGLALLTAGLCPAGQTGAA